MQSSPCKRHSARERTGVQGAHEWRRLTTLSCWGPGFGRCGGAASPLRLCSCWRWCGAGRQELATSLVCARRTGAEHKHSPLLCPTAGQVRSKGPLPVARHPPARVPRDQRQGGHGGDGPRLWLPLHAEEQEVRARRWWQWWRWWCWPWALPCVACPAPLSPGWLGSCPLAAGKQAGAEPLQQRERVVVVVVAWRSLQSHFRLIRSRLNAAVLQDRGVCHAPRRLVAWYGRREVLHPGVFGGGNVTGRALLLSDSRPKLAAPLARRCPAKDITTPWWRA